MPLNTKRVSVPNLGLVGQIYSRLDETNFRSTLRVFFNQLSETVNNGVVGDLPIQVETGTARTLTASDQNSIISFTSSSAITVTLPVDTSEELNNGFEVRLDRDGTGTLTVDRPLHEQRQQFQAFVASYRGSDTRHKTQR